MRRRKFLATTASLGFGGCLNDSSAGSDNQGGGFSEGEGEPTVKPTDTDIGINPDNSLSMGDWYEGPTYGFTVKRVEAKTEFARSEVFSTDYEGFEMREDRQLTIGLLDIKNITNKDKSDPIGRFSIRTENETFEPIDSFDHEQFDEEISPSSMEYTEDNPDIGLKVTGDRWIEPGEVVPRSVTAVTPRVDPSEVSILATTMEVQDQRAVEVVTAWS